MRRELWSTRLPGASHLWIAAASRSLLDVRAARSRLPYGAAANRQIRHNPDKSQVVVQPPPPTRFEQPQSSIARKGQAIVRRS